MTSLGEQRLVVLLAGVVEAGHVLGGQHPDHAGHLVGGARSRRPVTRACACGAWTGQACSVPSVRPTRSWVYSAAPVTCRSALSCGDRQAHHGLVRAIGQRTVCSAHFCLQGASRWRLACLAAFGAGPSSLVPRSWGGSVGTNRVQAPPRPFGGLMTGPPPRRTSAASCAASRSGTPRWRGDRSSACPPGPVSSAAAATTSRVHGRPVSASSAASARSGVAATPPSPIRIAATRRSLPAGARRPRPRSRCRRTGAWRSCGTR